ncbi:MAG: helix-turn-helix transcriptional regulator [Pirellulales bacterium]|nr:helix-turn-helix transcriptional regulator [Pirellulales bacterium]
MSDLANNLRRIMVRDGLTLAQVIERTGLDSRTVQGLLRVDGKRPHARTLHRLAVGLGVAADELFQNPATLANRSFDRESNPAVDEVVEQRAELFRDWAPSDFDELYSRVGTGGALTREGTLEIVATMNRNREVHEKVALLLESGEAQTLVGIVQVLYDKVSDVEGA